MILTAQEAHAIAKDKKDIDKFCEKMEFSIETAAQGGLFETQEYIPWSVSDAAVMVIAGIYRDRGFAVEYEDRREEANSYVSCDNYSERLIKISWKDAKK